MTIHPFQHFPPPPPLLNSAGEVSAYLRRLWEGVYQLRKGKSENVIEVTLAANVASTDINDIRLSPQCVLVFDPKTANAAAELYGATMYVATADRDNSVWTITHANNAQTDRTFQVAIIG